MAMLRGTSGMNRSRPLNSDRPPPGTRPDLAAMSNRQRALYDKAQRKAAREGRKAAREGRKDPTA